MLINKIISLGVILLLLTILATGCGSAKQFLEEIEQAPKSIQALLSPDKKKEEPISVDMEEVENEASEEVAVSDSSGQDEDKKEESHTEAMIEQDKEEEESPQYILSDSNTKYLSWKDIRGLSKEELRIARNEIYARHGRRFQSQDLQEYFEGKDWYRGTIEPSDFSESLLNDFEKKNVQFLKESEDAAISPLPGLSDESSRVEFAGAWRESGGKWWYDNGDGSYLTNGWHWIDGNEDGIAECYYFGQDGWIVTNAQTPDGYQVDETGAWILNGIQQTKKISQWLDAYVDFLSNYNAKSEFGKMKFSLRYIDGDSVPELSIHEPSSSHGRGADLYTYYNGQVIYLGEVGGYGSFSYKEKENYIVWEDAGTGVVWAGFYQIKNGALYEIEHYEAQSWTGDEFVNCSKNGILVSESEYKRSLAKAMGQESNYKSAAPEYALDITPANIQAMKANVTFAIK